MDLEIIFFLIQGISRENSYIFLSIILFSILFYLFIYFLTDVQAFVSKVMVRGVER